MTTATKQIFHEGVAHACAHRVSWFFRLPREATEEEKAELTTAAEERILECVSDGNLQGELNYESDDLEARGWWIIED